MDTTSCPVPPFTPDDAATIQLEAIHNPASSGSALELPLEFRSPETQYRIRLTMLQVMGGAQPGPILDTLKADFLNSFRGVLGLPALTLFKAEWEYLSTSRELIRSGLKKVFSFDEAQRHIEAALFMRAFIAPYRGRGERIDFELFRNYIQGFTDDVTVAWLREIWHTFQLDKKQTFFRKLLTGLKMFRANTSLH